MVVFVFGINRRFVIYCARTRGRSSSDAATPPPPPVRAQRTYEVEDPPLRRPECPRSGQHRGPSGVVQPPPPAAPPARVRLRATAPPTTDSNRIRLRARGGGGSWDGVAGKPGYRVGRRGIGGFVVEVRSRKGTHLCQVTAKYHQSETRRGGRAGGTPAVASGRGGHRERIEVGGGGGAGFGTSEGQNRKMGPCTSSPSLHLYTLAPS